MGNELTTLVVIGTDCIGSCKSNYDKITTTTVPQFIYLYQFFQYQCDEQCDPYVDIVDT